MEYNISAPGKGALKKISLSDETFAQEFNEALIHEVITAHMAGGRAGTKSQKTKAEVSGGGRKPWKQKGTGRARAGSTRSPLWRKGGVIHAAKNRDFSKKVNRKAHKVAMRSILSELVRQERLVIVENISLSKPKTKDAVALLSDLGLTDALVITAQSDANVALSIRNIPNVESIEVTNISPLDLVSYDKVLVTVDAIKKLEERLQ